MRNIASLIPKNSHQLKAVGIPAARKTIYDDIKAINHFYPPQKQNRKDPHIKLVENGEGSIWKIVCFQWLI